jgi:type II secretion system protein H
MRKIGSKKANMSGFTLVEILVVVVILAVAMTAAVPMFSSAGTVQVQSAASMLAADLEYARSMAISRQKYYGISFDKTMESYQVIDQAGSVVKHPLKPASNYQVSYKNQNGLAQVDLVSADFDGTSVVKFNYIGAPYNASGWPLTSGTISLSGGGVTITITVDPMTGYIRVQ